MPYEQFSKVLLAEKGRGSLPTEKTGKILNPGERRVDRTLRRGTTFRAGNPSRLVSSAPLVDYLSADAERAVF